MNRPRLAHRRMLRPVTLLPALALAVAAALAVALTGSSAGQASAALPAAAGLVHHLTVRLRHLRQRLARMAVLPAGLAAALLPQRPRRRLAQPLSRRRPRGIPRRLIQPGLKLSDPLPRLRQLLDGLR